MLLILKHNLTFKHLKPFNLLIEKGLKDYGIFLFDFSFLHNEFLDLYYSYKIETSIVIHQKVHFKNILSKIFHLFLNSLIN